LSHVVSQNVLLVIIEKKKKSDFYPIRDNEGKVSSLRSLDFGYLTRWLYCKFIYIKKTCQCGPVRGQNMEPTNSICFKIDLRKSGKQ
jgi:hypothetical protein